jgi:hypothetical protein
MGGPGSGRWWVHAGRPLVEATRAVDVQLWRRSGALEPGRWSVHTYLLGSEPAGNLCVRAEPGRAVLVYRARVGAGEWEDVSDPVTIHWTPCRFGGLRPFFRCPGCGGRVMRLYGAGLLFRCRRCSGLGYQSQLEDASQRAVTRAERTLARLGGAGAPRPRGMHRATYARHRQVIERGMAAFTERWLRRLGRWPPG